jgi:hypothetical protein
MVCYIYLCSAANLFAAAIMKCWPNATELDVQEAMANHLKYAPNRAGGGDRKKWLWNCYVIVEWNK